MFNHPIFQNEDFRAYSTTVINSQRAYQLRPLNESTHISEIAPEIVNIMTEQYNMIKALNSTVEQQTRMIHALTQHTMHMQNPYSMMIAQNMMSNVPVQPQPYPSQSNAGYNVSSYADSVFSRSIPNSVPNSVNHSRQPSFNSINPVVQPNAVYVDSSVAQTSPSPIDLKAYRFSRLLRNDLMVLYRYWFFDSESGISVVNRNSRYGAAWRCSNPCKTYYSKRKKVVDEICRLSAALDISREDAVSKMMRHFNVVGNSSGSCVDYFNRCIKGISNPEERTYEI